MSISKSRSSHTDDARASAKATQPIASKPQGARPVSAAQTPQKMHNTQPLRGPSQPSKQSSHRPAASSAVKPGTPKGSTAAPNGSKSGAKPVPAKRTTTPWTIEAASRIASVTAKREGGTVKKGSLAADAMSRAMKNERNSKLGK